MVVLATKPAQHTAPQIAEISKVPVDYLFKVLQALARAGLVTGQRGKHGGYSLARAGSAITILDVVNAVDPIKRIHTCPLGIPSHGTVLCPLHSRLDAALCVVEEAFAGTTLTQIVEEPAASRPLCGGLLQIHA